MEVSQHVKGCRAHLETSIKLQKRSLAPAPLGIKEHLINQILHEGSDHSVTNSRDRKVSWSIMKVFAILIVFGILELTLGSPLMHRNPYLLKIGDLLVRMNQNPDKRWVNWFENLSSKIVISNLILGLRLAWKNGDCSLANKSETRWSIAYDNLLWQKLV